MIALAIRLTVGVALFFGGVILADWLFDIRMGFPLGQ